MLSKMSNSWSPMLPILVLKLYRLYIAHWKSSHVRGLMERVQLALLDFYLLNFLNTQKWKDQNSAVESCLPALRSSET